MNTNNFTKNGLLYFIMSLIFLAECEWIIAQKSCGSTQQWQQERIQNDASYAKHVKDWKNKVDVLKLQKSPTCENGPIVIPVAIHFEAGIVPDSSQTCAIELAMEQIATINEEFSGIDSDNAIYANFESCLGTSIGDACISFCIASSNHPNGYGLEEGDLAITFGQVDFDNKSPYADFVPLDTNWATYLNIFVGDIPIAGQAGGIPGRGNGDGVAINPCVFGTGNIICDDFNNTSNCSGDLYTEGETLTHELGHYLGLFHIWGDSQCILDDYIADTPPMNNSYNGFIGCASHSTCDDLPSSCGSPDMYMNYMSYVGDPCMYMFSFEQTNVMYATAQYWGLSNDLPIMCGGTGKGIGNIAVQVRLMLQGPLEASTETGNNSGYLMRDDLRTANYIPIQEPYAEMLDFAHKGNEFIGLGVTNIEGHNAIVDWVLLELRTPDDIGAPFATRAALLQRDGDVVDMDGISPVTFPIASGDYYVVAQHRNHLGVMTATSLTFDGSNIPFIDFSNPTTQCYGQHATMPMGDIKALWCGDTNTNRQIIFQGVANDPNQIFFEVLTAPENLSTLQINYIMDAYSQGDLDMDGQTIYQGIGNDLNCIFFNVLTHPNNGDLNMGFIIEEQIPK